MSVIPKFRVSIQRNGQDIPFSSVQVSRELGRLAPTWSVEFPYPLDLTPDDMWTIKRGYGGFSQALITKEKATNISVEDGVNENRCSISGVGEVTNLLEYCVPKTLVFVNPRWLKDIAPDCQVRDGIVKTVWRIEGQEHSERFFHPRLPKNTVSQDEFECILGPVTHQAIAKHLCNLIGYEITINTPDVPLVDTYTIPIGTNWHDAILANFKMWQPCVQVVAEGDLKHIYVLDLLGDDAEVTSLQKIRIDNPAIVSTSESDEGQGEKEKADHLIVTGRSRRDVTITQQKKEPLDGTIVKIPEIPLIPNVTMENVEPISDYYVFKELDEFNGSFGTGEEKYDLSMVNRRYHRQEFNRKDVGNGEQIYTLIREVISTRDAGGGDLARTTVDYKYGPNRRLIGSKRKEESYLQWPGQSEPAWSTLKIVHNIQNRFIKQLNMTLVTEIEEGLVLYERGKKDEKLSPIDIDTLRSVDKSRNIIDKDKKTTQEFLEMTYRVKSEKINRLDLNSLVQTIWSVDRLTGHTDVKNQVLENPLKDEINNDENLVPFRKYFHPSGSGKMIGGYGPCYHSPTEIKHDDITTEEQMEAIAKRFWACKGKRTRTIRLKTPIPLPFDCVATVFQIPDTAHQVNGQTVTALGGDYYLYKIDERISFESGNDNQQGVRCEQILTLRSSF